MVCNHNSYSSLISSYFWSGAQKFGVLILQLVSNIILARILSPNDFGYIGIIAVIVNIMQAVVEGGFGSAIVQRKNITHEDISTIFICYLVVAIILYIFLYLSAGFLTSYYKLPNLDSYIRVEGVILIINALCIVQMNMLIREMKFRSFFMVNFISVLISIFLAIHCALKGMGVWSFVIRDISKEALLFIFLVLCSSRFPDKFTFSYKSFISIIKFSFPVLLASLTRRIYDSAQALVIGRKNTPEQLGYYTQAKKMEEVPISGYADAASQVIFPSLSRKYEQGPKSGNSFLRKNIKIMNFLIIPIIAIAELCASHIFHLLFGTKWDESIAMFKILCLAGITIPSIKASSEALKAIGRSDLFFSVQLFQRVVGFLIILLSSYWGLTAILWALVVNNIIFYISNMFFNKKILSYPFKSQFLDLIIYLLLGSVIYIVCSIILSFITFLYHWVILIIIPIIYMLLYVASSYLLKFDIIKDLFSIIKKKLRNENKII